MPLDPFVEYQGYPCESVAWRRSPGLSPEFGMVTIAMERVKEIQVDVQPIPWRNLTTVGEAQEGLTAEEMLKFLQGGTVSANTAPAIKPDRGLNSYGELVLTTNGSDGDPSPDPETYFDVFVAPGGIEELENDLASARSHTEGTLAVPITDIRIWWQDRGVVFVDFNVRLRSGNYDLATVKVDEQGCFLRTRTAKEVLLVLFAALPGTPVPFFQSDLELDDPENVQANGDLAINVIRKLMDDWGLEVLLQPNNIVFISRRGQSLVPAGKLPVELGSFVDLEEFRDYEKATVTVHQQPPAVRAIGLPRVQRTTLAWAPAFQDVDKKIYPLFDIDKVWPGYDIDKVNRQIFVGGEKAFLDLVDTATGRLFAQRREIARRDFYRLYVPASMFNDVCRELSGSISRPAVPFLTDVDLEGAYFMPMGLAPMYESEIELSDRIIPKDSLGDADQGQLFLVDPIVQAQRVDTDLFKDIDAVQEYFDDLISVSEDRITQFNARIADIEDQSRDYAVDVYRHQQTMEDVTISKKAARILLEDDFLKAAATKGIKFDGNRLRGQEMTEELQKAIILTVDLLLVADQFRKEVTAEQAKIGVLEARFNEFRLVYDRLAFLPLKHNIPYSVVEGSAYSLDMQTGILRFARPACHMDRPFLLDGDKATVISTGAVTVTFGYELRGHGVAGSTSVIVTANGEQGGTPARVAGMSRPTPMRCRPIPVPKMRMYQQDRGTPMNQGLVIDQAIAACAEQLRQPRKSTGLIHTLYGFHNMALDTGVSSIQYTWTPTKGGAGEPPGEGDKPRTTVAINAPSSSSMPLGPGMMGQRRSANRQASDRSSEDTTMLRFPEDIVG